MDTDKTDNPIKEVLDGLFTLFESMETQNAAVLEFLKDQGLATDEKLAPYLNRAASASSVKWRAARARMAYLLAPAPKKATDQKEAPDAKEPQGKAVAQKDTQPKDAGASDSERKGAESKSTDPRVSAETESDAKGSQRQPNETIELNTKAEPKKAEPKETKQEGESEKSGNPGSNSTAASAKSTKAASENNSPDSKHGDESRQDTKSKTAAATQSENDQPRNPTTPASSTQSAK
jgi:hypothetical protein